MKPKGFFMRHLKSIYFVVLLVPGNTHAFSWHSYQKRFERIKRDIEQPWISAFALELERRLFRPCYGDLDRDELEKLVRERAITKLDSLEAQLRANKNYCDLHLEILTYKNTYINSLRPQ